MQFPPQMEEWKDSQSPAAKGCGCLALLGIGVLAMGFMGGAMMGDYIGPPEGAAEDSRVKGIVMLVSLAVLVTSGIVGSWLVTKRRR